MDGSAFLQQCSWFVQIMAFYSIADNRNSLHSIFKLQTKLLSEYLKTEQDYGA
jgi:hypothetical protein